MKEVINICAYKATDNLAKAIQLHDNHTRLMDQVGLGNVTSLDTSWIFDGNAYFMIAELAATGEIIAGARLEIKNSKNQLPIEKALSSIGKNLNDHFSEDGTAEFSGLWTSRKFASLGLSCTDLANAIVSLSYLLRVNCLLGICAESTANISKRCGFNIDNSFGQDLEYPRPGLMACIIAIKNMKDLPNKIFEQKSNVFSLIQRPTLQTIISRKDKEVEINYNLSVGINTDIIKIQPAA